MDLLSYWNLKERPFEATWDTRFYFQSSEHEEALDRLHFLVTEESMNMGMLTGEIGCGKTLLRALFTQRLESDPRFEVVVQENSFFYFKDLLGGILRALEADPSGDKSKAGRYERFREVVDELTEEHRHLVLVFDEAQEMNRQTLNELKLLTNLNGGGRNCLTLILLGQPELKERIEELPAINQRISLRFHLGPLNRAQTEQYLRHRLTAAGHPNGQLFTDEAVDRAHDSSRGVPREINRLAKLALEVAWVQELPVVTCGAVDAVIRDLERHQKFEAA